MSKATPGPWEVHPLGRMVGPARYAHTDPELRAVEVPEMTIVAIVKGKAQDTTSRANAALIASAPAMRDQLERCHARLSALAEGHPGTGRPWSVEYLVSEIVSLADECRRALPGEG